MRKIPVLLVLACSLHCTGQFVADSSRFRVIPAHGYFPPPFSVKATATVMVPVWRGHPSHDLFPGTVLLNPGSELYGNDARPDTFGYTLHTRFTRLYDTVSRWPLTPGPFTGLEIDVAMQEPASFNWQRFLQPFWMKRSEVTNGEYKAFVQFVRDSVTRAALVKRDARYLDKTYPLPVNPKVLDSLAPELMLTPDNRIFRRVEYDVSKLVYRFTGSDGVMQEVPVYPDTLIWMRESNYSYGEPMTRRYFGHPAFAAYPVVGVTWQQAKAYCHWMTTQLPAADEWAPTGYRLQADLPFEYEREYAANSFKRNTGDAWSLTDLLIPRGGGSMYDVLDALLHNQPPAGPHSRTITYAFGSYYTHPADISQLPKKRKDRDDPAKKWSASMNERGISGLGDNVSEWMNESFRHTWQPVFEQRRRILNSVQLGRLQKIEAVTLGHFYLQQFTILDKADVDRAIKMNSFKRPVSPDDIIFGNMPFSAVDSAAFFDLEELAYRRSQMTRPVPAATNIRPDAALERVGLRADYSYSQLERQTLQAINLYRDELPILRSIEDFYYRRNHPNGRLVCGGNWYDQRPATDEKNGNGYTTDAKVFLNPETPSSSVGFRYVIRLVPVSTP